MPARSRRPARLAVAVSSDGVRPGVSRARIRQAVEGVLRAERVRDAMMSVAFVSARAIARLNSAHLGKTGATDVIAFAHAPPGRGPRARAVIGDMYVCPEVTRANARALGVPATDELVRVVIHGTLHVLGWDHPDAPAARTRSPMWQRQERLLRTWRRRTAR